jgi:hypothetical protein
LSSFKAKAMSASSMSFWREQFDWYLFVLVDIVLVMSLNGAYVSATVQGLYDQRVITLLSLLLSLFKLCLSKFFVILLTSQQANTKLAAYIPMHLSEKLLLSLSLFNNVVVPILVEVLISPNCFLFAITSPPAVSISYGLAACPVNEFCQFNKTSYVTTCELALDCVSGTSQLALATKLTTSFVPPFHYSYQCASSVVSTFAPVYIYRSLLSILANVIVVTFTIVEFPVTNNEPKQKTGNLEWDIFHFIELAKGAELLLGLCINFTILFTFGVLFPPLLISIIFAILMDIAEFQWLAGREIMDTVAATGESLEVVATKIIKLGVSTHCSVHLIVRSFWFSLFVAMLVWSWILFDTLADDVGVKQAIWIVFAMFAVPGMVYLVKLLWVKHVNDRVHMKKVYIAPITEYEHPELSVETECPEMFMGEDFSEKLIGVENECPDITSDYGNTTQATSVVAFEAEMSEF